MTVILWAAPWLVCAGAAPPAVAVVSLQAPSEPATDVERLLRTALAEGEHLRVQSEAETGLGVDQARDTGWTCDASPPCLQQLATGLGVDFLFHVAVDPKSARVTLLSVTPRQGVVASWKDSLPAAGSARRSALSRWARVGLGRGGTLVLQSPDATRVVVDGEEVAVSPPRTALAGVAAGVHHVVHGTVTHDVTVGEGAVQPLELAAAPEVPRSSSPVRWGLPAAGGGLALVGALGGVIALGTAAVLAAAAWQQQSTLDHRADGKIVARAGQSRQEVERTRNLAVGLGAAGGVGTACGVVLWVSALVGLAVVAAGTAWALAP